MKRYFIGVRLGALGGVINTAFLLFAAGVEPAVYISTFITWLVIGLMIVSSDFQIPWIAKGITIAVLLSLPILVFPLLSAPIGALWNVVTTILCGARIGFFSDKIVGLAGPHRRSPVTM